MNATPNEKQNRRLWLYNISRYALALLFIVSGLTKAVNPFGLAIQLDEYFIAMGLASLAPLAELLSIALPAAETLLGLLLLFGLFGQFTRWAVACVMIFFTGLTLWIALENPVSDCGCFGEIIKLSNWATLWKNVIFDLFVVMLFALKPKQKGGITTFIMLSISSLILPIYCNLTLPIIENSPYAVGRNIGEQMKNDTIGKSLTKLEYRDKTNGKTRVFELEDTTWHNESRWEYVATHTTIQKAGTEASIKSLAMIDSTGANRADQIVSNVGLTYLIVIPEPNKLTTTQIEKTTEIIRKAKQEQNSVYILRAMDGKFRPDGVETLTVDRSTLSTMIANRYGGVVVIENGIVITKNAL